MKAFGKDACQKTTATLPLAQRGNDTLIRVALVARPSGKAIDPTTLEALHVRVKSEQGTQGATIPYTISNGELVVEVTADISRLLGLGVYTLIVTGRTPDKDYADRYHDYEIVAPLCNVVKSATEATTDSITAQALQALRGERGLSAYELAVQDGFKGTLQEWLASLVPAVPTPTPAPAGDVVSLEEFNKLKDTVRSLSVQQMPEDKLKAILSVINHMFFYVGEYCSILGEGGGSAELGGAERWVRAMTSDIITLLGLDANSEDDKAKAKYLVPSYESASAMYVAIGSTVENYLKMIEEEKKRTEAEAGQPQP
jgi:hypothetical protein|nr:MAG TPA: hypothetical protein [Caudoviricetes sp.]